MEQLAQTLGFALRQLSLLSLLDIAIVAGFIYGMLSLIRGTTAEMLVRGFAILILAAGVLGVTLNLTMINWLIRNSIPFLVIAVLLLFQPEIRRALEQVGRAGGLLPHPFSFEPERLVEAVAVASQRMSERRWGALIVIEKETGLGDYARTGLEINGRLSVEHLLSLFFPNSPLHDGAVIVRGDRIVSAGCVLPLAESLATGQMLGTRHRAGVGITEKTDAIAVIVSEETGLISVAHNGRLVRKLDEDKLRRVLRILYRPPARQTFPWQARAEPQRTRQAET